MLYIDFLANTWHTTVTRLRPKVHPSDNMDDTYDKDSLMLRFEDSGNYH